MAAKTPPTSWSLMGTGTIFKIGSEFYIKLDATTAALLITTPLIPALPAGDPTLPYLDRVLIAN
jgi:hypothetical protein